jgi:hypothetical protein
MNGLTPMYDAVTRGAHEERIQKAEEMRLVREVRAASGEARSMRRLIGQAMMRAGFRIDPGLQREQSTAS